jgi:hypothetical protein
MRKQISPFTAKMVFSTWLLVLAAGCATSNRPDHYYFQRHPVRVAVLPSQNAAPEPSAPIVFNKACEEMLRKRGFEVVSADRIVTYATSSGMSIRDIPDLSAGKLGGDLKVDYLLYSRIDAWGTRYQVIHGSSEVAGSVWLVESATGALMWQAGWHEVRNSGNGGGDLIGLLVDAVVTAVANTAFDVCAQMGTQAAVDSVSSLPSPGFEPKKPPQ